MTLEEAVAEFERGCVVVSGCSPSRCPTGEPYDVVYAGSFDLHPEGAVQEIGLYTSKELAARSWLESIKRYAANKTGTVYWRTRPQFNEHPVGDAIDGLPRRICFTVYSRLLISDKPQIAVAA